MFKRMQAASNGDRPSRLSLQSTTMECLGNALFGQSPNAWYVCPTKAPPFKYFREKLAVAVGACGLSFKRVDTPRVGAATPDIIGKVRAVRCND